MKEIMEWGLPNTYFSQDVFGVTNLSRITHTYEIGSIYSSCG
jgi:hypothetical protein